MPAGLPAPHHPENLGVGVYEFRARVDRELLPVLRPAAVGTGAGNSAE